jgi:hypothetical protein
VIGLRTIETKSRATTITKTWKTQRTNDKVIVTYTQTIHPKQTHAYRNTEEKKKHVTKRKSTFLLWCFQFSITVDVKNELKQYLNT